MSKDFPQIDIIVPVYRGVSQTRRCIDSLLRTCQNMPDVNVVVIDDAAPEPEITRLLGGLERAEITLLHNEKNVGFVKTANRGLRLHGDRDVIILNSDTEVANDWILRLRDCAQRVRNIGTVTPFSNNATICSYPSPNGGNDMPDGYDVAALDKVFRTANRGRCADLPTAVGFCMYIRRACLRDVGLFDEQTFGRGYGEENDFCMRASAAGWRNVIAADTFVYHEGHVSFGDERLSLQAAAMSALVERYPDYPAMVSEFVARDPLGPYRQAADKQRLSESVEQLEHILSEHHSALREERGRLGSLLQDTERELDSHKSALSNAETIVREYRAEAEKELAEYRRALSAAQGIVRQREQEIESLNAQLHRIRQDYERSRAALAALEHEHRALEHEHRATQNELGMIKASRSWRYTRFLRRSGI